MEYLSPEKWREFGRTLTAGAPDVIVAIARKMPRILEHTGLTGTSPCPIVSERALPWLLGDLPREDKLTFCDDVLNVGTTLAHHVNYVRGNGFKDVRVAVFARHQQNREMHARLGLVEPTTYVSNDFDTDYYHEFETALPLELATLGKPYDVDFPIIEVPLVSARARTGEEWFDLLQQHFNSVHDLTTSAHRRAGVLVYTIISPYALTDMHDSIVNAKLRLYVSRGTLLRIVPMVIGPCAAADLASYRFLDPMLQEVWGQLTPRAALGAPYDYEPLYALWLYLHSLDYARPFIANLELFTGRVKATLSFPDLCFLYGQPIARELQPRLERILETPRGSTPGTIASPGPVVKAELVQQIIDRLMADGEVQIPGADAFRAIMRLLDERITHSTGDREPAYERLRVGLPLSDIGRIVRTISSDRSSESYEYISFLLDYHIDIGAVVPVIEMIGDTFYRTYRPGEATPLEFAAFVHDALLQHERHFPKTPLTSFTFTKILSALAIYHPGKLPLRPIFERHGSVPYMISDDALAEQMESAVSFLVRKNIIRRHEPPAENPQLTLI